MANALTGFVLDARKIADQLLAPEIKKAVGSGSIEIVKDRIRSAKDVSDATATAYSPRGPIYIPTGHSIPKGNGSKFTGRNHGVGRHGRGYIVTSAFSEGFNKTALTYLLTSTSYRGEGESRSGNSLKFRNWAAFKRYLGHSGNRDLEVTGRMLGAMVVTDTSADSISLGFTDDKQEAKMRANQKYSEQWGFSEKDEDKIFQVFSELVQRINIRL